MYACHVLFSVLRSAYGAKQQKEPVACEDYSSTHRPDLDLADQWVADLKLFSPIPSKAEDTGARGKAIAFGNTRPRAREVVLGLREAVDHSRRWYGNVHFQYV